MAPIGQKHRVPKSTLGLEDIRGSTSGRRDFLDSFRDHTGRRKEDHVLAVPRSAAWLGHIAQRLSRSAAGGDLLELALREEADVAAVGRPEGVRGILSRR